MKFFLLVSFIFFGLNAVISQELWQRKIDAAQVVLCKKDSVNNCTITISSNAESNLIATTFIINKVDEWQNYIAINKTFSINDKVKYLRILLNYVTDYNTAARNRYKVKEFNGGVAKELFNNFDNIISCFTNENSLETVTKKLGFLASKIIIENEFAPLAKGYTEAKETFILKDCNAHPKNILTILSAYPNFKYADSLITVAAYQNQDKIYDFAQCKNCVLYSRIKNSPNPLVQTLYAMAQLESGRSLTPFLDAISRQQITIDTINKIQQNRDAYYKLLVHTRIKYAARLANGNDIIALDNFNNKIKEVALDYVKEINEAHTKPDPIRFAPIVPLNAQELYYMAVYGIDELFTSSFNRGVFAQLITKLNGLSTDKFLNQVGNDYFRKFIKISANYNKLAQFLKLMPDSSATVVMDNFVSNLVQDDNVNDIEDAVDVADAFVGIAASNDLQNVSKQILLQIKTFQKQYKDEENVKGETIYRIFDLIFRANSDTTINLATQLGIPPINKVEYNTLATAKGKTIVKLYFYGDEDKDGQYSFLNFMGLFGDKSRWKVEANPYFVNINSIKGKPIQILANRALYDVTKKTDPDDTAKQKMNAYMAKLNLQPTFVMHRGHSYHVPITLKYMEEYDTSAKLIVLGSCGGYQNLKRVLEICPDAHIVSSKQTGTMHVNDPMLREMFKDIGEGKNIIWPPLWARIKTAVGGGEHGEMFDEYIPPNKNLGMIFIKAYKKQMKL